MGVKLSLSVAREMLPYRPYSPVTAARTGADRVSEEGASEIWSLTGAVSRCQVPLPAAAPNWKNCVLEKRNRDSSARNVMVIFWIKSR